MPISRSISVLGCLFAFLLSYGVHAEWPQWRGPTRDGMVAEAQWPVAVNEQTLTPVWRVDLGPGYSGPIVSGNRVFTLESRDAKDEVVRAFNAKTGEKIWEQSWPGSMRVPFFAKRNGDWVKATPATDGEHLYAIGMQDVLVCMKAADGEMVWKVDFKERYGTSGPSFGQPCSPLLDGGSLYIQAGMSVCKLDKKTGKTLWRAMVDERQMMGGAFSSPIIATVAGKRQLLVQTRGELAGLNMETGDVLWRQVIKAFRGMNILPPTVIDNNHIFTSSYGGGSFLFEIQASDDATFSIKEVWSDEKIEGYMSSPMVIDGHIYMHGRHHTWWCFEAMTGKVKWNVKDKKKFGEYTSMVTDGKRILALGYSGNLMLINPTPAKLDIISEHRVSEQETWGHIAVNGPLFYIRELRGLSVFQFKDAGGLN